MIAALPMYDPPVLRGANDRYWNAIRTALGEGPAALTRDRDPWDIWQSDDLLLAQTCGLPFRAQLHDRVILVGTPDYGLPGCPPGYYNSVIITRTDGPSNPGALDGLCLAYNEPLSQSGWAAPQEWMRHHGIRPGRLQATGAHAVSARAVREGTADFAALDALTWALLEDAGETRGLRVLDRTTPTPGLPYITAQGRDPAWLRRAVARAIDALAPSDRHALHLRAIVAIPARDYRALALPVPPETQA